MIPSIFYNPDDEADRNFRKPGGGSQPSPSMARMRSCVVVGMLIRSTSPTEAMRLRRMKAHVMGLRLPVARLATLWSNARDEALFYARPERAPLLLTRAPVYGCSMPEYAEAAWLVMRAALSLLVNVPLGDERDAEAFVDIVTTSGHVLPKRQQRRAISIARRYVACAIKGRPFAPSPVPVRKAA
jgi:hypothetical protein